MTEDILKDLNLPQREAVTHMHGPSVILAGAGSGKTRVLIHKVAYMILKGTFQPEEIIMITFTNKAAGEMKERIARMITSQSGGLGFVGTYHAFCAKVLRISGRYIGLDPSFAIYTPDDQESVVKRILKSHDVGKLTPAFFLSKISEAKNQLTPPELFLETYSYYKASQVAQVYTAYQRELEIHHAVDFDDLLTKTVALFRTHPLVLDMYRARYKCILIDEFQDTNLPQYVLAQLLASSHGNITVVGDFAQAIYSWRGADIRNLQRFSADFENAKTYRLEVNYRSTQRILAYAYEKISQNSSHPILQLQTENAPGEMVVERSAENEEQEALLVTATIADGIKHQGMRYDNFAVLYRTNAQSRAIEEALLHADMPYALVGGVRFYDRKEIKDILAYLRLLIYRDDPVAQERIQKLGKRKYAAFWLMYPELHTYLSVGSPDSIIEVVLSRTGYMDQFNKDDLEDVSRIENIKELKNVASRMTTLDAFFDHVSLIESERYEGERKHAGAGVKLMSLHASKGLEFDTVFIVGLEEGILPHSRSVDDTYALEEERRLFYVGITRARRRLYISWAQRRGMWGRRQYAVRSRFITQPTPPESSKIDDIINNWDVDPSVNQWSRYDDDQVTF